MALTKPFAEQGEKKAISLTPDAEGTMNYQDGFGQRYSLPVKSIISEDGTITTTGGLWIQREQFNQLMFDTTSAIIENQDNITQLNQDLGNKDDLTTTNKDNIVSAINELDSNIGDLQDLTTTEKSNVVSAVNEIDSNYVRLDTEQTIPSVKTFSNVVNFGSIVNVNGEANFNNNVEMVNTPTITNPKTFQDLIDNELITKAQSVSKFVDFDTNQSVSGLKTFTTLPQSEATPTDDKDLTTKLYVDTTLSDKIAEIGKKVVEIGKAMGFKGIVENATDLPTDTATEGDMYYNKASSGETEDNKKGFYVFNGTAFDFIGATISMDFDKIFEIEDKQGDLTQLKTTAKDNLVNAINENYDSIETNSQHIADNEGAISTINDNIGNLQNLTTTAKTSVVNAINEIDNSLKNNNFVTLDTNQSVSGLKTFTTLPQSEATPTDDKDLTTKLYVDTTLSDKIAEIGKKVVEIGKAMGFKGIVENATDLPTDTATEGDMYYNKASSGETEDNKKGFYVFNGTAFDFIGATISMDFDKIFEIEDKQGDLTQLKTTAKDNLVNAINENYDSIETNSQHIADNEGAISTINDNIGNLQNLTTTAKTSVVNAINEIDNSLKNNNFVTLDTNQSVSGLKTFTTLPQSSVTPANDTDLVTKSYVDTQIADIDTTNLAKLDSNNQFTGENTFDIIPKSNGTPTNDTDLVTKAYVDNIQVGTSNLAKLNEANTFTESNTFEGEVTFANTPTITNPTEWASMGDNDIPTKKQIQDNIQGGGGIGSAGVTLDTEQTITGLKTFDTLPQSSVTPANDTDLVTKSYVDTQIADIDTTNLAKLDSNNQFTGENTFDIIPKSNGTPTNDTDLATKKYIDDIADNKVSKTGSETIQGVKTFASIPLCSPQPSTNIQLANKAYVDKKVSKTGDETIQGTKTFSNPPVCNTEPTNGNQLANKDYVDSVVGSGDSIPLSISNQMATYDATALKSVKWDFGNNIYSIFGTDETSFTTKTRTSGNLEKTADVIIGTAGVYAIPDDLLHRFGLSTKEMGQIPIGFSVTSNGNNIGGLGIGGKTEALVLWGGKTTPGTWANCISINPSEISLIGQSAEGNLGLTILNGRGGIRFEAPYSLNFTLGNTGTLTMSPKMISELKRLLGIS